MLVTLHNFVSKSALFPLNGARPLFNSSKQAQNNYKCKIKMIVDFWIFSILLLFRVCLGDFTGPSKRQEMMLTDEQLAEFEKFSEKVKQYAPKNWMGTEMALYKYFEAAGKKADAAITYYRESLKMRMEGDDYALSESDQELMRQLAPMEMTKDKLGRELLFIDFKRFNLSEIVRDEKKLPKVIQAFLWACDQTTSRAFEKFESKKYVGSSLIIDLHGADLSTVFQPKGLEAMKFVSSDYEKRFPRVVHILTAVNAPPTLEFPFNILKGVLSEYSKKVIKLYGEDDTEWAKDVSKFAELDYFPQLYMKSKSGSSAPAPVGLPAMPAGRSADGKAASSKTKGKKKSKKASDDDYDMEDS